MAQAAPLVLEQARFLRRDTANPELLARSPGFHDDWLPAAQRLILGFGNRPAGVACPYAVFARPLGDEQVAVVIVSDVRSASEGPPNHHPTLIFHVLVAPRRDYEEILGDPFYLARQVGEPSLATTKSLETIELERAPVPPRTIEQVRAVLRRVKAAALREDEDPERPDFEHTVENSESPALLGGVQVLVDGGKLVFERPAPDQALLEGLWTLLPEANRATLWPATFAFSNLLGFDVVVVPKAHATDFEGYTNEEQAADYPPGRYEMNLQVAAETGDQRELDRLLNRRTSHDTLRLGGFLLVALIALLLMPSLIDLVLPRPNVNGRVQAAKAAAAAGMIGAGDPWTIIGMKLHGDALGFKQ